MNNSYMYLNETGGLAKTRVVAVINQKGGVGKTTTAANLGYQLAKQGRDVLLIDFDSQASLTNYFNIGLDNDNYNGIYELMLKELTSDTELQHRMFDMEDGIDEYKEEIAAETDEEEAEYLTECLEKLKKDYEKAKYLREHSLAELSSEFTVRPTYLEAVAKKVDGVKKMVGEAKEFGVSLMPSRLMLSDYELEITNSSNGSNSYDGFHLRNVIKEIVKVHEYDYVIIDCNPSLGLLSSNAIIAATDGIIIPTNLDVMSTRGIRNLINHVVEIQEGLIGIDIEHYGVIGIVLNLYAERRTVDQTLKNDMERFYPFVIFKSQIPESINAKRAALTGITYSQISKKADDAYAGLTAEFEEQIRIMHEEGPKIKRIRRKKTVTELGTPGESESE